LNGSPAPSLRIGNWRVEPALGRISRDGESIRLEARTMRLLLCLAERPGEVVSIDELLNHVWSGVIVTSDSVYQAVASLRRLLGDDPRQPTYIATVPRLGYRLVAVVDAQAESVIAPAPDAIVEDPGQSHHRAPKAGPRPRSSLLTVIGIPLLIVAGIVSYQLIGLIGHPPPTQATAVSAHAVPDPKSIAVLPFLDLTDAMNEEPFADGMTEELIGKLSKVPGLRVPAPTASFYFKGKQTAVADIARSLGVAYVLDGSVRKSGAALRVSARLVRADNGFVVWSENYDRPVDDKLMVQDEIASEVTKALKASID
jgi:transcriptional activator of cad operon